MICLNICDNFCDKKQFTPQLQEIQVFQDVTAAWDAAEERMACLKAVLMCDGSDKLPDFGGYAVRSVIFRVDLYNIYILMMIYL